MGNGMKFGVMQRGVFGPDDDLRARFSELMAQARVLNELAYDSVTTGSHFSTHPHREFMQVPYLCRVMAEAPNLRLNAGIVLLSLHNPLEVAENFAAMDVMSGGRVIFGCALGYRDVEYKAFGVKKVKALPASKKIWRPSRPCGQVAGCRSVAAISNLMEPLFLCPWCNGRTRQSGLGPTRILRSSALRDWAIAGTSRPIKT